MKGIMNLVLAFGFACFCSSACGINLSEENFLYTGIEGSQRTIRYRRGEGDDMFSHKSPQAHTLIGLRLNENLSFEMGYFLTHQNHKIAAMNGEDNSIKSQLSGWSLGFMSHMPLTALNLTENFEGLLYGGLSIMRFSHQYQGLDTGRIERLLGKDIIPRIVIGVQYHENRVGVRALFGAETTKMFRNHLRMKTSYFGGVGVFTKFY